MYFLCLINYACLAAEDNRQLLLRQAFDGSERRRLSQRLLRVRRQSCSVAGQPMQRRLIEAVDQSRQQTSLFLGQGNQCADRFGSHGATRLDVQLRQTHRRYLSQRAKAMLGYTLMRCGYCLYFQSTAGNSLRPARQRHPQRPCGDWAPNGPARFPAITGEKCSLWQHDSVQDAAPSHASAGKLRGHAAFRCGMGHPEAMFEWHAVCRVGHRDASPISIYAPCESTAPQDSGARDGHLRGLFAVNQELDEQPREDARLRCLVICFPSTFNNAAFTNSRRIGKACDGI